MNIFISSVYLRSRPTENQPCLPNEKKKKKNNTCFQNLHLRGRLCFALSGTLVRGAGKHVLAKTAACLFACWLENEKAHSHICTSLNGRLLLLTYSTRMSAGRWRKRMNWTQKNPSDTSPKVSYKRFPAFFLELINKKYAGLELTNFESCLLSRAVIVHLADKSTHLHRVLVLMVQTVSLKETKQSQWICKKA